MKGKAMTRKVVFLEEEWDEVKARAVLQHTGADIVIAPCMTHPGDNPEHPGVVIGFGLCREFLVARQLVEAIPPATAIRKEHDDRTVTVYIGCLFENIPLRFQPPRYEVIKG